MRTVHPSIMIGSYVLDQDRVPRDEFQIRQDALNQVMDARGLKAILVYGDAAEHSALAWFSNFAPRLRWGMALLPREGEPRLLISMSSRDVPAMKLMTWIADVLSGWTWEIAFDPWLARLPAGACDVGTVGFDLMRPPLYRSLEKSLGNRFRLQSTDAEVAALRKLRPREHSQIRDAVRVAQAAAVSFVQAWRSGMDMEAAALAGERTARLLAAQDVRTLVSFDGGRTLAPYRGTFTTGPEPFVGYIAVKHRGYWADMFLTAADGAREAHPRALAGLDTVLQKAAPGVGARTLHAAALAQLGGLPLHPVLSGSVGRRIGLSLNEGGELTSRSAHVLEAGEVYALHVGAHDPAGGGALASAMIAVTASGTEILCRSAETLAPQASPA